MRRRHVRTVREDERPSLLLMAAGAVAGAAAGLYLGRRYRSLDAFLDDMRGRFGGLREIWLEDDLVDEEDRIRMGIAAERDEEEGEGEPDDIVDDADEFVEDELHDPASAAAGTFDDEGDEDVLDDEEDEDDDAFDDDLADITNANGAPTSISRGESARRLEVRVLKALGDEPVLGERAIEIAVVGDGVVELTGTVRAIEEVSRASALVRSVPGVSMVLNRIDVRMGGHIDTASVARDQVDAPAAEDLRAPNE